MCPQQNTCACGIGKFYIFDIHKKNYFLGYTQCMQNICCLRKRHRVARTLKMNDEESQTESDKKSEESTTIKSKQEKITEKSD